MVQHKCKHCEASFEHPSTKRVYCSNECYHQSRIGQKQSEGCIEKRRQSMVGKTYGEQRRKNIGLSRQINLSEEKQQELRYYLEAGMPDGYVASKVDISERVYRRYKKLLYPAGILWQIKWLENDVELSVVQEVVRLTKLKYRYKRIASLVGLGIKTVKLILTALNKKDPEVKVYSYDETSWSERKESGPERTVREYLESKQIGYRQEVQMEPGSKWFFDFHITGTNLLVEVQGDYWHCNPTLYKSPINEYQRWAQRRDFAKKDYAKKIGYSVLPIWENDLETNKDHVFSILERTINKCKVEQ